MWRGRYLPSSFPFLPRPGVSLGKRKIESSALRSYALNSSQEKAAPSPIPFIGSDVSTPVCSLWPLLGILSFRVGTFGYYVWGRETFCEGSVGPGMTMSGPLGTNEMQSVSTSIQASCFQNFDYDPQFTS